MVQGLIIISTSAAPRVELAGDGMCHVGQLLLLLLKILSRGRCAILLEPLSRLLDSVEKLDVMSVC